MGGGAFSVNPHSVGEPKFGNPGQGVDNSPCVFTTDRKKGR